jgi:hypothetical protein
MQNNAIQQLCSFGYHLLANHIHDARPNGTENSRTFNETLKQIFQRMTAQNGQLAPEEQSAVIQLIFYALSQPPFDGRQPSLRERASDQFRCHLLGRLSQTMGIPLQTSSSAMCYLSGHTTGQPFPPFEEPTDPQLLIYLLADFCSDEFPDKGYNSDKAAQFLLHYLHRYLASFPQDLFARNISNRLSHYQFCTFTSDESQQELIARRDTILHELRTAGYVCFAGGFTSWGGGHALLYELFLSPEGNVQLAMTNSGSGLHFHPSQLSANGDRAKGLHYRQIIFPSAPLEDLLAVRFLETLLFFCGNGEHLDDANYQTIESIYALLVATWPIPGSDAEEDSISDAENTTLTLVSSNLGADQQGGSCAWKVFSKWMKGIAQNDTDLLTGHHHFIAWLKLTALMDHITQGAPKPPFLQRAMQKIAGHLLKMHRHDTFSDTLYQLWQSLRRQVENLPAKASEDKTSLLPGATESQFTFATVLEVFTDPAALIEESPELFKFFLGDFPPSPETLRAILSITADNTPLLQAVYINFLHHLPSFDTFSAHYPLSEQYSRKRPCRTSEAVGKSPQQPTALSDNTLHFSGTDRQTSTAVVGDKRSYGEIAASSRKPPMTDDEYQLFVEQIGRLITGLTTVQLSKTTTFLSGDWVPDLINGWLIIYSEALRNNSFGDPLYRDPLCHEWICALDLLLSTHEKEWSLASAYSFRRLEAAKRFVTQEKKRLSGLLTKKAMQIRPNYWTPLRPDVKTYYNNWHPFYFVSKEMRRRKTITVKEMPAMAHFAFHVIEQYALTLQSVERATFLSTCPEKLQEIFLANVKVICPTSTLQVDSITKINKLFQALCIDLPIPFYNSLRSALTSLYLLADPLLSGQNALESACSKPLKLHKMLSLGGITSSTTFDLTEQNAHYFSAWNTGDISPEVLLAKAEAIGTPHDDFNAICQKALHHAAYRRRQYDNSKIPLFTDSQEAFWRTRLGALPQLSFPEALAFFRSLLFKLTDPALQRAMTHTFFYSLQWEKWLDEPIISSQLSTRISMLRTFLYNGYEAVLPADSPSAQFPADNDSCAIAGYLFYLHGLLVSIALDAETGDNSAAAAFLKEFLDQANLLLAVSRKNAPLCKALGEAAFVLHGAISHQITFARHNSWQQFLASVVVLDLLPALPPRNWFAAVQILHGYNLFLRDLCRLPNTQQRCIWQRAIEQNIGMREASSARWEEELQIIHLPSFSLDLRRRKLFNATDHLLRILPAEITNDLSYNKIFGSPFPALPDVQPDHIVYYLHWQNREYRIVHSHTKNTIVISRKILGHFCSLVNDFKYQHQSDLKRFFSSYSGYNWWKAGLNTIYIEEINTHKLVACAVNGKICKLSKEKPTELFLADHPKEGDLLYRLLRGSSPSSQIWLKQDGSPSHLVSITFDLQFLPTPSGKWTSKEFPGFTLSLVDSPLFLSKTKHLILENEQQQYKYVCLMRPEGGSRESRGYLDHDGSMRHTIVFDANKRHPFPVIPPTSAHYPQLAFLISQTIGSQLYKEALDLVLSMESAATEPMHPSVSASFNSMVCYGKQSPEYYALYLRIAHWQLSRQPQVTMPWHTIRIALQNYRRVINHLGQFQLSPKALQELQWATNQMVPPEQQSPKPIPKHISFSWYNDSGSNRKFSCFFVGRIAIVKALGDWQEARQAGSIEMPSMLFPSDDSFFKELLCHYYCITHRDGDPQLAEDYDPHRLMQLMLVQECSTEEKFRAISLLLIEALILTDRHSQEEKLSPLTPTPKNRYERLKEIFEIEDADTFYNAIGIFSIQAINILAENYEDLTEDDILDDYEIPLSWIGKQRTPQFAPHPPVLPPLEQATSSIFPGEFFPFAISLKNSTGQYSLPDGEHTLWESSASQSSSHMATADLLRAWAVECCHSPLANPLAVSMALQIQQGVGLPPSAPGLVNGKSLTQDLERLKLMMRYYRHSIEALGSTLLKQEQLLLARANNLAGDKATELMQVTGHRPAITVNGLLFALARNDWSTLRERNPSIAQAELQQIVDETLEYAVAKTHSQRLIRCYIALANYKKAVEGSDSSSIPALGQAYAQAAHLPRAYTPSARPALLVFELLCRLAIRPEQVKFLDQLLQPSSSYFLSEAKTGFGKSKVIIPLWLMLNANSWVFPVMVIPTDLFDQQVSYLQKLLKEAVDIYGLVINFSRQSPADAVSIAKIHTLFTQAKAKRLPIFMSSRSAQSLLVLKLKELALNTANSNSLTALNQLLELRSYIKSNCIAFIDEPHLVLDDSHEDNYSTGQLSPLSEGQLDVALALYDSLLTIIENRYRLTWYAGDAELPLLTEKLYRQRILTELLATVYRSLNIEEGIKAAASTVLQVDAIVRYLRGELSAGDSGALELALQEIPEGADRQLASLIRALHDQLHHYLPHTVTKRPGESYALADANSDRLAVHVTDARQMESSASQKLKSDVKHEFVVDEQTINLTIQANCAVPLPMSFIDDSIQQLKERITNELHGECLQVEKTAAYRSWQELIADIDTAPKSLFAMTPQELVILTNAINSDHSLRLRWIKGTILLPHRRSTGKVVSNAHLLAGCFTRIVGASATMAIQNIPHQFTVQREYSSMANSLALLLAKYQARNNPAIAILPTATSSVVIDHLATCSSHASVILDAGSLLCDFNRLKIMAAAFLSGYSPERYEGVVVFDRRGAPQVLCRGHKKLMPKSCCRVIDDKLLWIYGPKDVTGVDQPLPVSACGILLINSNTMLTTLIQAIGRLRQLATTQDVEIAIDEDSASTIRSHLGLSEESSLTLQELLFYCLNREGEVYGKTNFVSMERQIKAHLEQQLLDYLIQNRHIDTQIPMVLKICERLLKDEIVTVPLQRSSMHSVVISVNDAIDRSKKRVLQVLDSLSKNLAAIGHPLQYAFSEGQILNTYERILKKLLLPEQIQLLALADATQSTEAEAEQETSREVTSDTLSNINSHTTLADRESWHAAQHAQRQPLDHLSQVDPVAIKSCFDAAPGLRDFLPLCADCSLEISSNALYTLDGDCAERPGWINGYIKPLHFLAINPNSQRMVLIDEKEADGLLGGTLSWVVWQVNHGPIVPMDATVQDKLLCDLQFQRNELLAKVLNGDLLFNRRQWCALTSWIVTPLLAFTLRSFIDQLLLPIHQDLANATEYKRLQQFLTQQIG